MAGHAGNSARVLPRAPLKANMVLPPGHMGPLPGHLTTAARSLIPGLRSCCIDEAPYIFRSRYGDLFSCSSLLFPVYGNSRQIFSAKRRNQRKMSNCFHFKAGSGKIFPGKGNCGHGVAERVTTKDFFDYMGTDDFLLNFFGCFTVVKDLLFREHAKESPGQPDLLRFPAG